MPEFVRGAGYGIVADSIGIIDALIGSWLLPQLGIHLGAGIISSIIAATIGAIILLIILLSSTAEGDGDGARSRRVTGARRQSVPGCERDAIARRREPQRSHVS